MTDELAVVDEEREEHSFEFAISSRLRHGELWKLVKQFGTQAALARYLGLHLTDVNRMVNMRHHPPYKSQRWPAAAEKLVLLTGKTIDELFPDWSQDFLTSARVAETFRRVPVAELRRLQSHDAGPVALLVDEEAREQLAAAMSDRLSAREHAIVERRFGLHGPEQTLREVSQELGMSKERVRQIEYRALRKLGTVYSPLSQYFEERTWQLPPS